MQINWEDCLAKSSGEILSIVKTSPSPHFKKDECILSIETTDGVFPFLAPFNGRFEEMYEECYDGIPGSVALLKEDTVAPVKKRKKVVADPNF